ncbi:hypothetical protein SERLADRAFT_369186 [Serpula lacrymans var. lacrymans S7.9]|uniref:Uncharacterized protein n=1 Tax=Serpula lacrymans var. lacrymans (strain S7.9) TaxID=578457 RepID=F8NU50_SERL9|nr:uncharacterized protein SERLADRAFT_369186 [Serpula lacrymans var. lacrymans S7.9]EGO25816.1 hypothetical protein SERLADRAFT_369186 [Serpula lacrymans var. lacrymans S7.9]
MAILDGAEGIGENCPFHVPPMDVEEKRLLVRERRGDVGMRYVRPCNGIQARNDSYELKSNGQLSISDSKL